MMNLFDLWDNEKSSRSEPRNNASSSRLYPRSYRRRTNERSSDDAGRVELGFHRRDGHDRLELAPAGSLPQTISSRPAPRLPLPPLSPRRTDHAVVQLRARLLAQTSAHPPASHVAGVGPYPRPMPLPVAGHLEGRRRLQAKLIFRRTAHGLSGGGKKGFAFSEIYV